MRRESSGNMLLDIAGLIGSRFMLVVFGFGTGIITRKYPSSYGIKHYQEEEWYAQFMWPIFKSKKEGSELSHNGPVVGDAVPDTPEPITLQPDIATNTTVAVPTAAVA